MALNQQVKKISSEEETFYSVLSCEHLRDQYS